ncbi:hypothetical protein [Paenibacillus sp. GYB003]|uniref:hypothetical protein n=1 Tax=Paenibacillus sp. GYB003 TaxID=2994392 RepID=UPI002F9615CA
MADRWYNPFEDKTLHASDVRERTALAEDRTPFNDALRHGDAVQGYSSPKRLDQFPKRYRNPQRVYATISVLVFAAFMAYQVVRLVLDTLAAR